MKNIYKALASFQQEVPAIHKGTKGYGYTYADLPTIFATINPILAKNGLGFTQLLNGDNIITTIFHSESGETLQSETVMPTGVTLKGMNEFQVMGSAITYYRRYSLSAILGLVTDVDSDASGEQTSAPSKPWLNTGTKAWDGAVKALTEKSCTMDQIKAKYSLKKENEATLKAL
jgi:hypothetical protein